MRRAWAWLRCLIGAHDWVIIGYTWYLTRRKCVRCGVRGDTVS